MNVFISREKPRDRDATLRPTGISGRVVLVIDRQAKTVPAVVKWSMEGPGDVVGDAPDDTQQAEARRDHGRQRQSLSIFPS